MAHGLEDEVASIEAALTVQELVAVLQRIAENRGFASFAFVDVSLAGATDPLVLMTNRPDWDRAYRDNGFLSVDPALSAARRRNVPFSWGELPHPVRKGRRVPGPLKTLFAARDHGFREGVVVPFHYVDRLGRPFSSVCTFFWTDRLSAFVRRLRLDRHELHVILLYWAQRVIDLEGARQDLPSRFLDESGDPLGTVRLTDRERDVLSWAARGKTAGETATILAIAEATVVVHLKSAMRKLGSPTKTSAATRALYLGLIDL